MTKTGSFAVYISLFVCIVLIFLLERLVFIFANDLYLIISAVFPRVALRYWSSSVSMLGRWLAILWFLLLCSVFICSKRIFIEEKGPILSTSKITISSFQGCSWIMMALLPWKWYILGLDESTEIPILTDVWEFTLSAYFFPGSSGCAWNKNLLGFVFSKRIILGMKGCTYWGGSGAKLRANKEKIILISSDSEFVLMELLMCWSIILSLFS